MPPSPTDAATQRTRSERFFAKAADIMTTTWDGNIFVWLPAISTDPNTGPTLGILPVLVLSEKEKGHIRHLLAPSYTYNSLFKQTVTMRYYYYPTDKSQLFTIASFSQKTNREARIRYENSEFRDGRYYLRAEGGHRVDGSLRFYGIGPNTTSKDERGYTGEETKARGAFGVNLFDHWRTSIGLRFRRTIIKDNIVDGIKDLRTSFPTLPGVEGRNTVTSEARILWDTRDLPVTPSKGDSGELYVEKTNRAFGSDSSFFRFGMEGKRLIQWNSPKHLSVMRVSFDQVKGSDVPFNELSFAGGRDTLRGYGEGRFADHGRIVLNLEHRVQIASLSLMGVQTNFEVGPFFDIGTVFPHLSDIQRKDFRPVFGGAFRAAVKPNVVGAVDVGVGKEGVAVFVDINYPF